MSMRRPYEGIIDRRVPRERRVDLRPGSSIGADYGPAMQIDAVIFDWGGTLTRWHDIDFHAESLALAHAVVESEREPDVHAERAARGPTR